MITMLDILLMPFGLLFFICGYPIAKLFFSREGSAPLRRIMILSLSGYEAVKERGVEHLRSFDNDFFDKVYFVCPTSSKDHDVDLSDRMKMIDFAYPRFLETMRQKGLKYSAFLFGYTCGIFRLAKFVKAHRVAVVRAMEPHVSGSMGILLKRLLGVKHVQDIRGNFDLIYLGTGRAMWLPASAPGFFQGVSRWCERLFERFVFKHSDFVFGGNKNNLDYAIYRGASLLNSAVVRVNIQPDLFEDLSARSDIREKLALGTGSKAILYCGRLHEDKYPQDVIAAFKMFAAGGQDSVLLLAGDGPERGRLEEMVSKGSLEGRVRFLGFCDNMFLKNLFVSVDLIVCPLGGSVLIEAALASLPIVAYDFEWHSELVVDGYSGLLVNFKNIAAMSAAMQFMLQHPEAASAFGRRAREIATSLLDPEKIMMQEKNIYADLLSSRDE